MSRIDKYLWCVRLFKTRSMASEACKKSKVFVNNEVIKSSRDVKIGDIISLKKNTALFSYEVIAYPTNRVGAALVKDYLKDITPAEEKEKYQTYLAAQKEFTQFSFGKPSKQDRRKLNRFLGS